MAGLIWPGMTRQDLTEGLLEFPPNSLIEFEECDSAVWIKIEHENSDETFETLLQEEIPCSRCQSEIDSIQEANEYSAEKAWEEMEDAGQAGFMQ